MIRFKEKFLKEIAQRLKDDSDRLLLGGVQNMQDYGFITGRVSAFKDVAAIAEEVWLNLYAHQKEDDY